MTIREAFEAVRAENDGRLTAIAALEAAKVADTEAGRVISSRLEWDDGIAGEQYRLDQVRSLIRSVRVSYREPTEEEAARQVRGFVSVETAVGRAYEPVEEVASDPLLRQIVLRDAEREWKALYRKYSHLHEFFELVRESLVEAA